LRESYPDTEYAAVAAEKMAEARELLAEHELFYADFYFRMERYASALSRYNVILREFSDVPRVYEHAQIKSKVAFVRDREQRAEAIRLKREGSWKDWFNWL
jgi:outer membrane protein assembly factor BamD